MNHAKWTAAAVFLLAPLGIGAACGGKVVIAVGGASSVGSQASTMSTYTTTSNSTPASTGTGSTPASTGTGSTPASTGTGQDECAKYVDDLIAKYKQCGITVSTSSTASGVPACTQSAAVHASCLDACLPKVDCTCTKDPTGYNCATAVKPYNDCVVACASGG